VIRILRPGDGEAVEAFLAPRASTSMFMRSNVLRGGLEDRGQPLQATYAAAFQAGRIAAVAAHCWNGMLLLQAPEQLRAVAIAAIEASGRTLKGISGPADQVRAARDALGVRDPSVDDADALYSLELSQLRIPDLLSSLRCRHPEASELPQLIEWREEYLTEIGLGARGPSVREQARSGIELLQAQGAHWVLEEAGALVSYTAFNARLPDIVQVGGVWTPKALRGRGYARCAVAHSLLEARAAGARRSILFTNRPDAVRAYEALGFRRSGEYGLLIL